MSSNAPPPASIGFEKIIEIAKNSFSQVSLLFSVIMTKFKDVGDAVIAAIRRIDVDLLKELFEIFHYWFAWFLVSIFALMFTDTGKAFFSANYSFMKAMFVIKFVSFLITLLATLSQMHKRNIAPLLLMLVFEIGASLLAVGMISRAALWFSLTSWLCIFVFFGYCCYTELEELISQIKRWFENHNPEPEGSILPVVTTVTETAVAEQ